MNPGKDVNSNQPKNTPAKNEVFQTPWQTNFLGTKEKVVLIRSNSVVTAQIISQNIFRRLFAVDKKFTIEKEIKFTDISEDRFKSEKQELQKLLAKHASVNDMLLQIEKDLKKPTPTASPLPPATPVPVALSPQPAPANDSPKDETPENNPNSSTSSQSEPDEPEEIRIPTLTPEEIEIRQTTVQSLRDELESLMNKIRKQEIKPHFQSYERLKKSTNAIKDTVYSTFSNFEQLYIDADNPAVSLLDLQRSANALKALNTKWFNDLGTIKQTFVEGLSLKEEIEKVSSQIQSFPEDIQSQWQELVKELQQQSVSNLASAMDVHMVRQKLSRAVAKIILQCKEKAAESMDASLDDLKQHLDATAPVFEEKEKQQAHLDFRDHIVTARKKARASLDKEGHLVGYDLEKIAEWQQEAAKAKTIDEALAHMLMIRPAEESYLEKLYSIVTSPLSALSNPLKAILPTSFFAKQSSLLAEKAFLDEASAVYVDQAFHKINSSIVRLLDTISASDEKGSFIERHKNLVMNPALMKSDLDSFIDGLIRFSMLAATIEDETFTRETIQELCNSLSLQKEAFTILLNSREHHTRSLIKKAKAEYPTAFDDSVHPAILEAALAAADKLHPEAAEDIDIKAVSHEWQNHRIAAASPLKTLKTLEAFGRLQNEYQLIAKNRKIEIGQLTGAEKAVALSHLEALEQAIHCLDSISGEAPVDASMLADYHNALVQANNLFAPLLSTENNKKELRNSVHKEIDNFLAELDTHDSTLSEIERHLSVQLKDTREMLKQKRQDILGLKNKGSIPSTFLNYVPNRALGSIYYYGRSLLSYDEINVSDLSLQDLAIYIEHIKAEIAIHKTDIARSGLAESQKALSACREESQALDAHVKKLTSAATKKSYFGSAEPSLIPSGIDATDEPKLQFYNAHDTETKHKAIQSKQKQAITGQPNLKFILKQLKADEQALKKLLEQSKKTDNLSLLHQIDKLESNPEQQKLAKLAYIETMTTKMAGHSNMMASTANVLKNLPRIHEEAVRLIDKTKLELSTKLRYTHTTIQSHAELWEPIRKDGSDYFSTKKGLSVDSLTAYDLHSYSEMIDHAIKTGSDHMELIKSAYSKAESASKKYQRKVYEAKDLIKKLDNKDQLISRNKMEYILADVEKTKENYSGASTPAPSEGWFSSLSNFIASADTIMPGRAQSQPAVLKLLDDYKKNIGESIARIDAAMHQIAVVGEMTIPHQLNISPNDQTTGQLRERYSEKTEPVLKDLRDSLEKYKKNGTLQKIYGRYVDQSSYLFKEIERAIDAKLMELDRFEQGHQSDGMLSSFFSTSFSDLSAHQMEKYTNKLNRFQSALEQDLDDKFQITTLRNTQVTFLRLKNEHAKAHAAKLRKHGHYTEAHKFEEAISKIEKEEAKWEKMVTSSSELKSLDKELKKLNLQMLEAIQSHDASQQSLTYDEQVKKLLEDKNSLTSPYNYFGYTQDAPKRLQKIEADVIALKSKIISKVESSYQDHQDDLKKLITELDDLFLKYDIRLCYQSDVLHAIDKELYKFSYSQSRFDVTDNTLSSFFYTPKKIEDMSMEEIAQIKPEEKHEDLIKASIKSITDIFNYQHIRAPHTGYTAALENAEKAVIKLKDAGQIIHANDLSGEIKRTQKEYDEYRKNEILDETGLRNLGGKLNEFKQTLEMATAATNSQVEYTAIQQLGMLPIDSPFRDELKNALVKGIQTKISENKASIKKGIDILDKLTTKLGLPAAWHNIMASELEQNKAEIVKAGNGLPVTTLGWFTSSVSTHTLGELSVDQLAVVQKDVNAKTTVMKGILERYCLDALSEQFDEYLSQLDKIQKQKFKWKSELQNKAVTDLEKVLLENSDKLKSLFADPSKELTVRMGELRQKLEELTSNIITGQERIAKSMPKLIATLMIENSIDPTQHKKLLVALETSVTKKRLAQTNALNDYKKKINAINDLVRVNNPEGIPYHWKTMADSRIKLGEQQLSDTVKGLPDLDANGNIVWKSFNDLSNSDYEEYEKMINRLTDETKDNTTSVLSDLSRTLHLDEIKTFLNIFNNEVAILEKAIKRPAYDKEKIELIKYTLEANKKLVFSAFKELKTLEDSFYLLSTIGDAQARLIRTSSEVDNNKDITLDPWAKLCKYEADKKAGKSPSAFPIEEIIEKPDVFSFSPKSHRASTENKEISSFQDILDKFLKILEAEKAKGEQQKQDLRAKGLDKDHPIFKKALNHISIIPEFLDKFNKLKEELPKSGKNLSFEQLLNYRNKINRARGDFDKYVNSCKNTNNIYWDKASNVDTKSKNDASTFDGEFTFVPTAFQNAPVNNPQAQNKPVNNPTAPNNFVDLRSAKPQPVNNGGAKPQAEESLSAYLNNEIIRFDEYVNKFNEMRESLQNLDDNILPDEETLAQILDMEDIVLKVKNTFPDIKIKKHSDDTIRNFKQSAEIRNNLYDKLDHLFKSWKFPATPTATDERSVKSGRSTAIQNSSTNTSNTVAQPTALESKFSVISQLLKKLTISDKSPFAKSLKTLNPDQLDTAKDDLEAIYLINVRINQSCKRAIYAEDWRKRRDAIMNSIGSINDLDKAIEQMNSLAAEFKEHTDAFGELKQLIEGLTILDIRPFADSLAKLDHKQRDVAKNAFSAINDANLLIIDSCKKANSLLNNSNIGATSHISEHIVEDWCKRRDAIINSIESINDLDNAVKQIKDLSAECKKYSDADLKFCEMKAPAIALIEETRRELKEPLELIEKTIDAKLSTINIYINSKLDDLKKTYKTPGMLFQSTKDVANLTENDMETYQQYILESGILISEEIELPRAKVAAENFQKQVALIEEKLEDLRYINDHIQANKLSDCLKSAKKQLKDTTSAEYASDLAFITFDIDRATEMLKKSLAGIINSKEPSTNLVSQLKNIPESNDEHKFLKARLTNQLKERAVNITTACNEISSSISKAIKGSLKNEIEDELKKYSNTVDLNKIDLLTKDELFESFDKFKSTFEETLGNVLSLKGAINTLNSIDVDTQEISVKNAKEKLIAKTPKRYPSFYIDKTDLLMKNYVDAANNLKKIAAANVPNNINNFKQAIDKFEKEQNALNVYCASLEKVSVDDVCPFAQLKADKEEGGILKPTSKQAIYNGLKTWVADELKKILKALNDYKDETTVLPPELQNIVHSFINETIQKRRDLEKIDFEKDSPENLKKLFNKISNSATAPTRALEKKLDLKTHMKRFKEFKSLIAEAATLLDTLRKDKRFDLAADLQAGLDHELAENKILLQGIEETWKSTDMQSLHQQTVLLMKLSKYWTLFSDVLSSLNRTVEFTKSKNDLNANSFQDQINYFRNTYKDNYKDLQDYKDLIKARNGV